MKISVLGASGFLGQNLCRRLVAEGHQVIGYVLNPSKEDIGYECRSVSTLIDVLSNRDMGFDVTINVAARRSTKSSPLPDEQVREFTYEIPKRFILATASKNTLVINASTYIQNYQGVLGKTIDAYAFAKESLSNFLEAESEVYGFQTHDLFFFTIYGIGDRGNHLVPLLLDAAKTGSPLDLSPGFQLMNLLSVDDAVQNILECIPSKEAINYRKNFVWSDDYFSVRELAKTIELITGKNINCEWGAREYAGHEMMEVWPIPMQQLPGFLAQTTLEAGISKIWKSGYSNS